MQNPTNLQRKLRRTFHEQKQEQEQQQQQQQKLGKRTEQNRTSNFERN